VHLPVRCCVPRSAEEDLKASRQQADSARATRRFFAERARASVDFVSFFSQSSANDGVFHLLTDL